MLLEVLFLVTLGGRVYGIGDTDSPESASNATGIPKLDDPSYYGQNAAIDFWVIMGFGLFTLQLNFWGSIYVIYRTYKQWKSDGASSITLSLRFPFYIALTDVMLSLAYTVNLGYTAIYKVPWPQPQCGVVGAYVVALFALNILLVGFVALSTWLRVCREIYVETGVYDYKLWLTTISISMLIVLISIRDFGPQKYWCAADDTSTIIPLIMLGLIALSLVTIIFCYLKVLLKIKNLDDTLLTSSYASPQRVYIEKRALRKLISYIFTFLLQFIPLLAYQASSLLMIKDVFLYLLAATTINFGGIGNFIQYLINEGLFSPIVTDSSIPSFHQTIEPKIHLSSSENTIESNETGSQRFSSVREEDKGEENVGDHGKGYTLDNNYGGVYENNGYDENRDSKIDKDFDEVNPKDVEAV